MTLSVHDIIKRLKTKSGRDFTLAVLEAFKYLGFEVEDIERKQGTQAHSDLIVKAHLATDPYFAVLECTAVREGSQVGYQKLYQLGSNFPRYVTKYGQKYPSASYKMLVGRPEFSKDAKKLAKDTTLLAAETLTTVLTAQETLHFSQDELERLFKRKGELSSSEIHDLTGFRAADSLLYALIFLSLLEDPADKSIKRKKEWTSIEQLTERVRHWGWLLHSKTLGKTPDDIILTMVHCLSSEIVRALLVDGQKVMISSLPFKRIVQNMGDLGEFFESLLMNDIDKINKMRQTSSET